MSGYNYPKSLNLGTHYMSSEREMFNVSVKIASSMCTCNTVEIGFSHQMKLFNPLMLIGAKNSLIIVWQSLRCGQI